MMIVTQTPLKGLLIFEPTVFKDNRGCFFESFNESIFENTLKNFGYDVHKFVQDNHSISNKGVVRGLHYQLPPFAQAKLVRVIKGSVIDVAVDIRKTSQTFGQWFSIKLTQDNHKQLWIPQGFAHGFVALEEDTHFLYKTTNFYHKKSERSIFYKDKTLVIDWQMDPSLLSVSDKDNCAPAFDDILACDLFE